MLIEEIDKYLVQVDRIDTVNSIGIMDIEEIVEFITDSTDEYKNKILGMLDINKRKEVEKLIEGGVL